MHSNWRKKIELETIADKVKSGKIEIGDIINYKAEDGKSYTAKQAKTGNSADQTFTSNSNIKWKVWGIDEKTGGVMIVPSLPILDDNNETLILRKIVGYNNGVTELNNISAIYGTGKAAISARSLDSNDIDKLFGVTEEMKIKSTEKYREECRYNNVVTIKSGIWIDGSQMSAENPRDIRIDTYDINVGDEGFIDKTDPLYDLVFINDTDDTRYFLADKHHDYNGDLNYYYNSISWDCYDGIIRLNN